LHHNDLRSRQVIKALATARCSCQTLPGGDRHVEVQANRFLGRERPRSPSDACLAQRWMRPAQLPVLRLVRPWINSHRRQRTGLAAPIWHPPAVQWSEFPLSPVPEAASSSACSKKPTWRQARGPARQFWGCDSRCKTAGFAAWLSAPGWHVSGAQAPHMQAARAKLGRSAKRAICTRIGGYRVS